MEPLRELGVQKSFKFIVYSILAVVYHNLIDHLFYISYARTIFLTILGAKIGTSTIIMDVKFFNWHHKGPKGLAIGNDCFVGDQTLIDFYDEVILEDQVTIAQRVTILTHTNVGYKDHPLQKFFPKSSKPVIFKSGSVVGAAATILPGVIIGRQSFVAAGSVVTKNVPPHSVVAGVPARVMRILKQ